MNTTAAKPQRVDWIDIAKGISIALVTWHHTVQYASDWGMPIELFEKLNYYLAPIRMPLFFAVSGVFSMKALSKSWPDLLRSRVALMFWLLICWSAIRWLVHHYIAPSPVDPEEGRYLYEIALALLGPDNGIWFLWSLGIYFVIAKALMGLPRAVVLPLLLLVSIWAGGYLFDQQFLAAHPYLQNLAHRNTIRYFLFFYFASQFPALIFRAGNWQLRWLAGLAPAAMVLSLAAPQMPHEMLTGLVRLAATIAGVAALFIFSRAIRPTRLGEALRYLGQNTLPVYVAQIPVLCIVLRYAPASLRDWTMVELAPLLLLLAAFVVASTLALRMGLQRLGAGWLYALPQWQVRRRSHVVAPAAGTD